MPAYMVKASQNDVVNRVDGTDMVVVFAADAPDAKAMAKALHSGDGNASWDAATATQIAAASDYEGWRLRVRVTPPNGVADLYDFTYTGASSDTIDLMGAGMAALLNVPLTSTYTGATQVLIVATGSGADDLGDHSVLVEMLPPLTQSKDPVAIPGFIASGPTHEGSATDDLNVTLEADAYVVPLVSGQGKQS